MGPRIRPAGEADRDGLAELAATLATSYPPSRSAFDATFDAVLVDDRAALLVAESTVDILGYVLGSYHPTFYANGPVAVVEEILVREHCRGQGVGRALMSDFEEWAAGRGCRLVTLATRRAAPFYLALGYTETAASLRRAL